MIPHGSMTEKEKAFLNEELSKATSYLEWGAGWSTLWAIGKANIKKIVVVEGNQSYLDGWVRAQPEVELAELKKRLRIIHATTLDAAWPTEPDEKWGSLGLAYAKPARLPDMDFTLVDGRFRVACTLTALLIGCKRVAIHDFFGRPHYEPVLAFFDVVKACDSFVLLKPKRLSAKKLEEAQHLRAAYFKDPR